MRRSLSPLLAAVASVAVAVAACSSGTGSAVTTTTSPTTTAVTATEPALEPVAGAPGVGDPYYPQLGNGGYDVSHYDLQLRWDPDAGSAGAPGATLSGTATIELVPVHDLSSFNLDLVGLTVRSVTVDGAAATTAHVGRELTVTPDEALATGRAVTVVLAYGGVPAPLDVGTDVFDVGWHTDGRDAFVVSEPAGAATWFPANDHPSDKATYDIAVTVPSDLAVIANGTLVERTEGAGTVTFRYESDDLMASYLASVVVGDLVFDEGSSPTGVPLRSAYPRRVADAARTSFAELGAMFEAFEDWFGPYPFAVYGHAVVDEPLGFALENQTLSLFGTDLATAGPVIGPVVAHELAHQWFGNAVSPSTWQDIWLNEGFATFAEWIWEQERGGRPISRSAELTHGRADFSVPPADPGPHELFHPTVYLRGGLVLYAIYDELGEARFKELLRTWVSRHDDGTASTRDLRELTTEIAGRPLDHLFEMWLLSEELPPLP